MFLKVVKGVASLWFHTILPLIHSKILKIPKSTPESSQLLFYKSNPGLIVSCEDLKFSVAMCFMSNLCEYIMKNLDCQTQHALGWQ